MKILIFWIKFAQEGIFGQKLKTLTFMMIIEFRIFKLVPWYQIYALTDNFDFFDQICPK